MRFGIMAMQLEALIPPGIPAGQLLSRITTLDHAGLAGDLFDKGFNPIELGGDLSLFLPHTFAPNAIQALEALKTRGVKFTVHLPLWSVEPSTPLEPVRKGSIQAVVELLKATLPLEPEVYVLHASGALAAEFYRMQIAEMARSVILRQFQNNACESIKSILKETGIASRRLAIETVEFPLELTVEIAGELDLSICFDTGHVLAAFTGRVDFFEALQKCLPRMAEVHLHDCPRQPEGKIGYGEDHHPLGTGSLEIARFLDALESAGFAGPLVFELRVEEALQSLKVIRAVRPNAIT